jgi:hypothetical protein
MERGITTSEFEVRVKWLKLRRIRRKIPRRLLSV